MTNIIKILPEHIANKIAAGEVVQRPESVIKELIENSIDAGAENVELIIKNAGKTLIQVIDDGKGMSEDDAIMCIKRHSTSKIKDINDLENINTFGFRGEALSSISAISRLEIKTRQQNEELGIFIEFEDDSLVKSEKIACAKGTSISVKNLFYNVPARRNFLKSNATELKHIIETFKKISISYCNISFKLINDEEVIYDLKKSGLIERMQAIFADNIEDALIEVNEPTEFLSVSGYISKPTFIKKSRAEQYIFVNRRFVVSRLINHSIFSAYENILIKGDYPFFILFLDIDPHHFDINVHPAKLEIKFDDETAIYSLINAIIKKSLSKYDLVPNIKISDEDDISFRLKPSYENVIPRNDFSDRPSFELSKSNKPFSDSEIDVLFDTINNDIKQNNQEMYNRPPIENQQIEIYHQISKMDDSYFNESAFIVLLHNKYILAQIKSGLMIIDSHVAHERILYERALKSFEANIPFSQQLLFSQSMHLDQGDYELLKELETHLSKLGFALRFSQKNIVFIDGVPADIKVGDERETIFGILSEYKDNRLKNILDDKDNLAKSYACKAAIKAGDKLNDKEMRLLVDQLFATSMPYVCPHGRPIVIKISIDEFDKRFGRK